MLSHQNLRIPDYMAKYVPISVVIYSNLKDVRDLYILMMFNYVLTDTFQQCTKNY